MQASNSKGWLEKSWMAMKHWLVMTQEARGNTMAHTKMTEFKTTATNTTHMTEVDTSGSSGVIGSHPSMHLSDNSHIPPVTF